MRNDVVSGDPGCLLGYYEERGSGLLKESTLYASQLSWSAHATFLLFAVHSFNDSARQRRPRRGGMLVMDTQHAAGSHS